MRRPRATWRQTASSAPLGATNSRVRSEVGRLWTVRAGSSRLTEAQIRLRSTVFPPRDLDDGRE